MQVKQFVFILCLILPEFSSGQIDFSPCRQASQIIDVLNANHLQPRTIDDTWSELVFNEFIYLVDPAKHFFTLEDLIGLETYKTKIDDALKDNNCKFLDKTSELLKRKLNEINLLTAASLKSPLNYSIKESLKFEIKRNTPFAANQMEFIAHWKAYLKLQTLLWMNRHAEHDLGQLNSEQFKNLESSAREVIKLNEMGRINRLLHPAEGFEKMIETSFLKAITHSFDPHTEYFTPSQNEDFNSALSSSGLSFGMELDEDHYGQIKIKRLSPGGPAWQSNELNQGDIVLNVKWSNQESIDIMHYDLDELNRDLEAASKNEVTLTIKKTSGQVKTIQLEKGKIELDQNIIRSFILRGEKTIGYISLPGFYSELEDQSNRGCADDIARELIKLKKEKINGLILDLRFNGGGSLSEALALAGIFIDAGPLALMQETSRPVVTLKDMNRGTIYDGPLLIMVNGFSASASELVSAVLQDLNRAIIVGKQTYGKATGQVIIPIDKNTPIHSGFLKVTNSRIYRITGKSLQKKGVVPDVLLPDFLDTFIERESEFNNALAADSISKKLYYTPLTSLPGKDLSTKSEHRQDTFKTFENIKLAGKFFSEPIPLELKMFDQYNNNLDVITESLNNGAPSSLYNVQTNQFDDSMLSMDNHRKEIIEELLVEIRRSFYIEEAYKIILDYISLTK